MLEVGEGWGAILEVGEGEGEVLGLGEEAKAAILTQQVEVTNRAATVASERGVFNIEMILCLFKLRVGHRIFFGGNPFRDRKNAQPDVHHILSLIPGS
jgi:hypothetical protein